MESVLFYIAKSAVLLTVLYIIYWLFLRNDTFFIRNRFYLLGSLLLSFVIPLINVSVNVSNSPDTYAHLLDTVTVSSGYIRNVLSDNISFSKVVFIVYLSGVLLFLLRFLYQIFQLYRLIMRNGITNKEGLNIVFTEASYAPFSFFNLLFLNKDLQSEDVRKIIAHEEIHIHQRHSLDILILEFVTIFQWFNPFVWMYHTSVKEVHEYLADKGVLQKGVEKLTYQKLLLSITLGLRGCDLANNFNKSLIKRRFIMMTKMKSGLPAKFKILLVFPLIAMFISVFACNYEDNTDTTQQSEGSNFIQVPPPPPPPPPPPIPGVQEENMGVNFPNSSNQKVVNTADVLPEFKGGQQALIDYMIKNIKYPENAKAKNIQGKVFVSFVISSAGKVSNVKVTKGVDKELDAEAVRCISSMPDWIPGKNKGKAVDVEMTLPVQFKLH